MSKKILLENINIPGIKGYDVYRQYGGYASVEKALKTLTPDEVVEATKDALRKGMPGGGFILSSSNSIHSAVKPENYVAMMRTLREYGRYS